MPKRQSPGEEVFGEKARRELSHESGITELTASTSEKGGRKLRYKSAHIKDKEREQLRW